MMGEATMSEQTGARPHGTYLATVLLLLLVLPAACVGAEAALGHGPLMALVGRWFVFWGVGVRLFLAGLRQTFKPAFTAVAIFEIDAPAAFAIVRELGFANLSMGALGLASLAVGGWVASAALVGGLYYGLAGAGHVIRPKRNTIEQIALISDLLICALLAAFLACTFLARTLT